ncbi:Uncharacterized protein C16C4.02c [Erysiphe neolycopersici]|uniref:Uncharacterized protein C16C4.02c n=1 Tax=Erysiphe neolycopersici TaxID=212602 RepID=A0A420HPG2_9PEZI|nr:Uncharacterized protein C16C4.02c [Erysiphe neolycopersici]
MNDLKSSTSSQNIEPEDSPALLDKIKHLFQSKDDTSRFVGFALLKTVLENEQVVKDPDRLQVLWESIPSKFMDRLLRAQLNENVSKQDADSMNDIAISVLHVFINLLPETCMKEQRVVARVPSLIKALTKTSNESKKLILQTLLAIVSHLEGSLEFLSVPNISSLISIVTREPLALNLFHHAWVNVSSISDRVDMVRQSIDNVMSCLVLQFKNTDAITLLKFTAELFPKLESATLPSQPKWLNSLVEMIRNLVVKKPTKDGRTAYTKLAASLLLIWPNSCAILLFENSQDKNVDSKPFSYLFVNLLLIDIRSTIPTLLPELNDPGYLETSQRLSAAFNIISAFLGFLVKSLDAPEQCKLNLAPDLLLKLRKNIAETFSLSIEYMRDRWDASVAGAAGLHPSARSAAPGARLGLTWESMKNDVSTDPLLYAATRTLAIWIREDENDNLRCESAGLMDMWIDLYRRGRDGQDTLDYRYSIALALEGIVSTYDGIESFLNQDGWQAFADDLNHIIRGTNGSYLSNWEYLLAEASLGIQIVKILLAVVDHPNTGTVEEAWMSIVKSTTGIQIRIGPTPPIVTEFQIAILQLSLALLTKAADGMTRRYVTSQEPLSGLIKQLEHQVNSMPDKIEAGELTELLQDVSIELANLRQLQAHE